VQWSHVGQKTATITCISVTEASRLRGRPEPPGTSDTADRRRHAAAAPVGPMAAGRARGARSMSVTETNHVKTREFVTSVKLELDESGDLQPPRLTRRLRAEVDEPVHRDRHLTPWPGASVPEAGETSSCLSRLDVPISTRRPAADRCRFCCPARPRRQPNRRRSPGALLVERSRVAPDKATTIRGYATWPPRLRQRGAPPAALMRAVTAVESRYRLALLRPAPRLLAGHAAGRRRAAVRQGALCGVEVAGPAAGEANRPRWRSAARGGVADRGRTG
jgi:hypothetical protein